MPGRNTTRRRSIWFSRARQRPDRTRRFSLNTEPLEERRLLSAAPAGAPTTVFTVGSALDLANAILSADILPVQQSPNVVINFDVSPGLGPASIFISSPLPAITRPMTIDGTTENGPSGIPLLELLPAAGANINDGLDVKASGVVIEGLAMGGFTNAIDLDGSAATSDVLRHDYLGVVADGKTAAANTAGVWIHGGASNNMIGGSGSFTNSAGASYSDGNLISGNAGYGIVVDGGSGNTIQGNLIGTDSTGSTPLANSFVGVFLAQGTTNNMIGGTDSGDGNLISGNGAAGVEISGIDTTGNDVQGNLIGADATGEAALPNGMGIAIVLGASGNLIGGSRAGASFAAPGNLISGNTAAGVLVDDGASNTIQGNLIGVDAGGTKTLGNGSDGIRLIDAATNNVVGGTDAGDGNLISGNHGSGVVIQGLSGSSNSNQTSSNTSGNDVQGNFIGSDAAGDAALPNRGDGITIENGASGNLIGGPGAGATLAASGNLISGNTGAGVTIDGSSGNTVQGNFIGVDAAGAKPVANRNGGIVLDDGAGSNVVGGAAAGEGNLISGNAKSGVSISGNGTSGNDVQGNFVGTDATGDTALENAENGVIISQGASGNLIGGQRAGAALAAPGNLISGNKLAGIVIDGSASNTIQGNFIGADASGERALANALDGVDLVDGAANNVVGGTANGDGNVISGNQRNGVDIDGSGASQNRIQGNYIGTNAAGNAALANSEGVVVSQGASDNMIGGQLAGATLAAPGNLISGNNDLGILIDGSARNTIQGNFIGADAGGDTAIANNIGVRLQGGAANNVVGGPSSGEGNLISGNRRYGIDISGAATSANQLERNDIGTDASGTKALASGQTGILIDQGSSNNVVGAPQKGNLVAFNNGNGIAVGDNAADVSTGNAIEGNSIFANAKQGIDLGNDGVTQNTPGGSNSGPNNLQNYPLLEPYVTPGKVAGTLNAAANKTYIVDFYANAATDPSGHGQGQVYLGRHLVTTGADGNARFTFNFTPVAGDSMLTATATDPNGNTSEFSQDVGFSLQGAASSISATEGVTFSGAIATFTSGESGAAASDFTADILWGDGSSSAGTVAAKGNGTFQVSGSHAYAEGGNDVLSVVITDKASNAVTAAATAAVSDVPLSANGTSFAVLPGAPLTHVAVATFTDANSLAAAADFTATIDWGDGSSSAGSITEAAGTFTVSSSHTYSKTTNETIAVTILDQGGAAAQATSKGQVGDANAQFVAAAYLDVLARPVDATGLAYWDQQLDQGQSRTVVTNLIDHSAEYFGNIIIGPDYSKYLGRQTDTAGLAYWVDQMQNHGLTDEELEAGFISSAEFYADAGKQHPDVSADQAWIEALFQTFLSRQPDDQGLNYWLGQLSAGTSRDQVALQFATSLERAKQRISDDYFHYLGRGPDQQGIDYWVGQFANGVTNENLITDFVASSEYFSKHTGA